MKRIQKQKSDCRNLSACRWLACILLAVVLLMQFAVPVCLADENMTSAASEVEAVNAVDPIRQNDGYSAVLYNNLNGLPTSDANDIAETDDGFIWIGSYSGLIRYDGNTFERMDSTTGVGNVGSLYVDHQDRLWIGTNDNGLAMMERGELRMWSVSDGLKSPKIAAITEDDNGLIYIGTTLGIATVDSDMNIHTIDDPEIADIYMSLMHRGGDGKIYGMSSAGDVVVLKDGKLDCFISYADNPLEGVSNILPDMKNPGNVYISDENSKIYYARLDGELTILDTFSMDPLVSAIGLEQIDDRVWICARNGIGALDDEGFHVVENLPMNNSVGHIMKDYEGNLWFTSARQGVMKIVSNQFSNLFARYGLPERVVNSTCILDGKLFIGTDTGLIVVDQNREITRMPLKKAETASGEPLASSDLLELLDGCRIRSIIRDSRNRLWFSTWAGCGLLRYDHGEVVAFNEEDGLLSDRIRAVFECRDGSILVAHSGGVCVIRDNAVAAAYDKDAGVVNPESICVCEAPNGDILLGSNGGGIYVINDKGTRCIGTKNGLTSGIVMRVKYDAGRNLFWIITSHSIAFMTPDYRVTTVKKFPYSDNLDLCENSRGDMWILSSNGIFVVPTEELLANGEIDPLYYNMANGLPCIATSNSYSELTPEGDLYLAGRNGVAKINIEKPLDSIRDLKISIPYLEADGERVYPDASGTFILKPNVHKVTVYSFIFNYSLVDPQVTYRLEGFDRESVTVQRSDLVPQDYTNIPGGTYRFVLQLRDSQGGEDREVSAQIVKQRTIFEGPWFKIMIPVAVTYVLARGIQLYLHRKTQALEKQHEENVEKERLITELQMASRIQASMLPHTFPPFPDRKEFDVYATMDPARDVGGDFYDFFLVDDDHLCLVMADVSGKGIPAALFMMACKIILQSCAMLGRSAAEILTKTNEAICSNNQMEMFITTWVGILEISTGRMTAANAGHEYPVVMRNGQFELLKDKHGFVIGGMDGIRYKEYELQLKPGDKLFLYTDGVPEATDADMQMFGTERMLSALNRQTDVSPKQILKNVREAVDDFVQDAEQFDDLTMLCLSYEGKQRE